MGGPWQGWLSISSWRPAWDYTYAGRSLEVRVEIRTSDKQKAPAGTTLRELSFRYLPIIIGVFSLDWGYLGDCLAVCAARMIYPALAIAGSIRFRPVATSSSVIGGSMADPELAGGYECLVPPAGRAWPVSPDDRDAVRTVAVGRYCRAGRHFVMDVDC